jgi:hypothetical protein
LAGYQHFGVALMNRSNRIDHIRLSYGSRSALAGSISLRSSALNYAELAKLFLHPRRGYHDLYRSGERQPHRAFARKISKFKTKSPSTKT